MLIALAAGAHADVKIVAATATDRNGIKISPTVGEPFFLTVALQVDKTTTPYRVTVQAPSGKLDTGLVSFGLNAPGSYWVRQGAIMPLFDGPMNITVACSAAKKPLTLRIVPVSPKSTFDYYARRSLKGAIGTQVELNQASDTLLAWVPLPESDESQSVSVDAPARQALTRESSQPIGLFESFGEAEIEASASFIAEAQSVRTNLASLRSVPMSAVKASVWLKPEARAQSDHKEIVAFAHTVTKGFTAKTPVADVALAVYSAVLKRSVYARTGALPDALATLRSGKGECGDLGALFVATCRAAGVPARTVSGFCYGNDQWHVWAEFQVPGLGWVPVDPAYAEGAMPHADTPLYFGVIPDLRNRIAVCRGLTQSFGNDTTTFLQTPQVFASDSAPKVKTARFWSVLEDALKN